MSDVLSVADTIGAAVETCYLDREGKPVFIPTGLTPLDDELGGLGPGACGILAAGTGVGKSSACLAAMLKSSVPVGYVSMEDTRDVVGTRLLAALSGVDSLRIRRKTLSPAELKKVNKVAETASKQLDHIFFSYQIGKGITSVEKAIADLVKRGARMVWVDYLQEIRGHGKGDRRNEVAEALTRCHGAAADGDAALMAVSQFRRVGEDNKTGKPKPVGIHHLKESGDLENKARVIILATKQPSPDGMRVRFKLAKSTYGGEGIRWDMLRDESGTLRNVHYYDPTEGM